MDSLEQTQSITPEKPTNGNFESDEQIPPRPEVPAREGRESRASDLRGMVRAKEALGVDATAEKIELIEIINNIQYSPEEKASFDLWRQESPRNSKEQPIAISNSREILGFLPEDPNYTEEAVNLFFSSTAGFSANDLDEILSSFSRNNPNF